MTNIYDYTDYRKFLQDFYLQKKSTNSSYSYTILARAAGISSRGLVKLIIDGKRSLSLKTIPKIAQGLKLNKTEYNYFFTMIQFNQTKNLEEKNILYQKLITFKGRQQVHALSKEQYNLYAQWYHSAIYEMLSLKDCPLNGEELYAWLSKKLFDEITPQKAQQSLNNLEKLGLITLQEGRFIHHHSYVENLGGEINFAAQKFQQKVIQKSLDTFHRPLDERDISGVTLAIKAEDIPKAKEFINEFRKNFNTDFSCNENADHVYQLNIQFYELTDRNFKTTGQYGPDAQILNSAKLKNSNIITKTKENLQ